MVNDLVFECNINGHIILTEWNLESHEIETELQWQIGYKLDTHFENVDLEWKTLNWPIILWAIHHFGFMSHTWHN